MNIGTERAVGVVVVPALTVEGEPKGAVSSDTIDPIIGFLLLRCWEFNNEFDCWPSKNIDEDEDEEQ